MRRRVAVLAVLSFLLLALFAGFGLFGHLRFNAAGPASVETVLVIPKGSGLAAIARRLTEAGVLGEPWTFRLAAIFSGDAGFLRAGEYAFPAGVSPQGVLEILKLGQVVERSVTFPEGISLGQALNILYIAEGLEGIVSPVPDEGMLLPETYNYNWGDARNALVGRMENAMRRRLESLWPDRQAGLPFNDAEQALILASIVEKETAQSVERPRIAAVFINRLRKGMRLQSDPTVVYALTGGEPFGRALTRRDLAVESPYNTYLNAGLPPGPICLPGEASLRAVLNPAESNELYFVADGSGGHAFAETLAEHNRNVAHWRKTRRRAVRDREAGE